MVFYGDEVVRSVLRNRVMKEDNLQIIYLTKPESKLKARKGCKWRGNQNDRLERLLGKPGELFNAVCKNSNSKTSESKWKTLQGWKWRGSQQVGSQESGNERKKLAKVVFLQSQNQD